MWRYVLVLAATTPLVLMSTSPSDPHVRATEPPRVASAVPPPAVPPKLSANLSSLLEEVRRDADGVLAINSRGYRATFSAIDGVVYTPRLRAADAGTSLRWQYRARSLVSEGTRTLLAPVEPRVSSAGDHIVDFVRPGLIERYVGRPDGVEQVFVLDSRPPGSSDIRIRGEVTFDGTGREVDGRFEFTSDGHPPFRYAAPVAFDADGRPLGVRATLEGDQLDLILDGSTLASARFPVTIDPLFGLEAVETFWNQVPFSADVAYNPSLGEFLVVYNAKVDNAVQEYDVVRAKRFREYGDSIGSSKPVSPVLHRFEAPALAYDSHNERYMGAWLVCAQNGTCDLRVQLMDAEGWTIGSAQVLGTAKPGTAPDVEARNQVDHGLADPSFAVVWQDSGGTIKRALLTGTGQVASVLNSGGSGLQDGGPSLSYDPYLDRYLVVWRRVWGQGGREIVGHTFAATPGPLQGTQVVVATIYTAPPFEANVALAFDVAARRHFVAFTDATGYVGQLMSSEVQPKPIGPRLAVAPALPSATRGHQHVAADRGSFLIALSKSGSQNQIEHRRLLPDGQLVAVTSIDWVNQSIRYDDPTVAIGYQGLVFGAHVRELSPTPPSAQVLLVSGSGRWFARAVHGKSGDFDGDGRSDLFLFRPASSSVLVRTQSSTITLRFASAGGIPVLLDWDGDGLVDVGVFYPSTGAWKIRLTATGAVETITALPGGPGDIPVPGDYYGDGADEIALFRPWTGKWYFRQRSSPQGWITNTTATLGQVGDMPVPADWDGDGKLEIGVFRQSTGVGWWHFRELDGTPLQSVSFGAPGDIPLQGHFVGGPLADQVVYRKATGTWHRRDGQTGATTVTPHFAAGQPMPLDYNGDGRLEMVLFNDVTGTWSVIDPTGQTNVSMSIFFGAPGDIPAGTR